MVSEQGSHTSSPSSQSSSPVHPKSPIKMSNHSSFLVNPSMKNLAVIAFPTTLKLNSSNFLVRKTQVQALVYGLDLFKFLDGSHPKSSPTVNTDGKQVPHDDYP